MNTTRGPASPRPGPSAEDSGSTAPVPRAAYVIFLVRGAVAFVLGLTLLFAGSNLSRLTTFVAIYWIVAALMTLRWAGAQRALPHRKVAFAAAVVGIVVGVAVLFRKLLDVLFSQGLLLDFLGASAIATGVLRLLSLLHDDQLSREHPRRRYRFVVGSLEVILGVSLVVAEQGATTEIRLALALWGLATGTFLLLDAVRLRRLAHAQKGGEAS